RDGPALAHVGTGGAGMLEQNVIEHGALDLDGLWLAIVFALAESETGAERAVAKIKTCTVFYRKARRLQGGQHVHLAEDGHVAGQQGFADVEPGKELLFEDEHVFSRAREV